MQSMQSFHQEFFFQKYPITFDFLDLLGSLFFFYSQLLAHLKHDYDKFCPGIRFLGNRT